MNAAYIRSGIMAGAALAVLTACSDLDLDLRSAGRGFDTSDAVRQRTEDRPAADSRGILSYSSYQVAVARRGDTVASVAARIGLPPGELAAYNGLATGDTLRDGEVLVLPRRVAEPAAPGGGTAPAAGAGAISSGPIDVAGIAGGAIDRAAGAAPAPAPVRPAGAEPIRHQVRRGETAYSIARLYNVSVNALAQWNGLGPDLAVREGQYLLIPVAAAEQPRQPADATPPGAGTPTPEPPSAKTPLPDEKTTPPAEGARDTPASPDLAKDKSAKTRLQMPVSGKIFREYAKGRNEGIDISAAAGAPVVAAEAGTVATVTQNTENVQIVVIRHAGNLLTVYAGLDGLKVKKGDKVGRGQQIGTVRAGSPPFLHFEVRQGLDSTDPVPFLN